MLRPWLYERDAVTVLARRNEALAAMHSEAMIRRFELDLDALESFVERYLTGGELRERLDSLPLDLDPTMQVIEETVNALNAVRHHHPDVAPAAQEQAIGRLLAALEEACEQVEFPREHWSGRFESPTGSKFADKQSSSAPAPTQACFRGERIGFQSVDILSELAQRFGARLDMALLRVRIIQFDTAVLLETTKRELGRGELVRRIPLDFIVGENDGSLFDPHFSPLTNANRLLGLDDRSIVECFDFLSEDAAREVVARDLALSGGASPTRSEDHPC